MAAPRFKYGTLTITYAQIPYVDRVYKIKNGTSVIFLKDVQFENLIDPKNNITWGTTTEKYSPSWSPSIKKLWKRWIAFKKKVEEHNRYLDNGI
jgi:hypothetical protein